MAKLTKEQKEIQRMYTYIDNLKLWKLDKNIIPELREKDVNDLTYEDKMNIARKIYTEQQILKEQGVHYAADIGFDGALRLVIENNTGRKEYYVPKGQNISKVDREEIEAIFKNAIDDYHIKNKQKTVIINEYIKNDNLEIEELLLNKNDYNEIRIKINSIYNKFGDIDSVKVFDKKLNKEFSIIYDYDINRNLLGAINFSTGLENVEVSEMQKDNKKYRIEDIYEGGVKIYSILSEINNCSKRDIITNRQIIYDDETVLNINYEYDNDWNLTNAEYSEEGQPQLK